MSERIHAPAPEAPETERQAEARSAFFSGFGDFLRAECRKGNLTDKELGSRLKRLDDCQTFEQMISLAEELGYGDAEFRPYIARIYNRQDFYVFLADATDILSKHGLPPSRWPKKPTREKYYALAKELGISREDFDKELAAKK